jgi:signal transduction histidine kinase
VTHSLAKPAWHHSDALPSTSRSDSGNRHWFRRDWLLMSAFAICLLLIGFEARLIVLHPPGSASVTDWLRAALAWPELLIIAFVGIWLGRAHRPSALSWWMWGAALLSYMIARNIWTIDDQLVFHHGVPFPTLPDLFFVLQYPFFLLAVILLPRTRFWGGRMFLVLDSLLVIGAAAALSWEFLLEPLYLVSGLSPLARAVTLAYPVSDLFLLCALTIILIRPSRYHVDPVVLGILVVAVICLIVADTWADELLLHPGHVYRTGRPPDLFWYTFYLLVPLAALVQFRLAQRKPLASSDRAAPVIRQGFQRQDLIASIRLFFPLVAALLASGALLVHATMRALHGMAPSTWIPSFVVAVGLVVLIIVRQGIVTAENTLLRRQMAVALANELAAHEISQRKDEFLGIVSHELKTPLTSLQGYIQLMIHRFNAWQPQQESADDLTRNIAQARRTISYSDDSVQRMTRLVDDLLDDARIREGRLTFQIVPCDLREVVGNAVAEQHVLTPERTIHLEVPLARPVPVFADAMRIEQVVTNYLSNAVKYSREEQPIAVRLEVAGGLARVSVHDAGPGVPLAEQAHVWERFHRIEGASVQSGSGVGLGIGLHISKTIIESHHGHVGVDSTPGQGATFWFTIPLAVQ